MGESLRERSCHQKVEIEEEQTLKDLELGPPTYLLYNLVMVPIPSYTDAYAFSNASLPMRALSTGYNIISGIISTAISTIWSLLGYGFGLPTSNDATSAESSSRQPQTPASGIIQEQQKDERRNSQPAEGEQTRRCFCGHFRVSARALRHIVQILGGQVCHTNPSEALVSLANAPEKSQRNERRTSLALRGLAAGNGK
jgi:hypothetical protein